MSRLKVVHVDLFSHAIIILVVKSKNYGYERYIINRKNPLANSTSIIW